MMNENYDIEERQRLLILHKKILKPVIYKELIKRITEIEKQQMVCRHWMFDNIINTILIPFNELDIDNLTTQDMI